MRLALWLKLGRRDWPDYVPIVPTLRSYERSWLKDDLTAGIVVGIISIPQAIAYAFLAGVPPEAGLYACLVPLVLYAVFGSAKQLVVGPVAVAALLVAATVSKYAPAYSDQYLGITAIICLQAGIILWLLRLSRMGGLVNLLSHPVITGFVNAAALLIIISQLPALTGTTVAAPDAEQSTWSSLTVFANVIGDANLSAVSLGVATLIFLLAFPIWSVRLLGLPKNHGIARLGPIVAAILALLAVAFLGLGEHIATVGFIPAGLPALSVPSFELALWLELLAPSAVIAVVSYVESFSIGTTLAARNQERVNPHQELIALGAANIGAAFTGAYPVAGSFSRSSVNFYAGGKTQVAMLFCAAVIVVALLFLTPAFAYLPHAVLAAIVMVSVVSLIDVHSLRKHWSISRHDTITELATFGLVLFVSVEMGLFIGVLLSIAFFLRSASQPNITQVGRLGETEQFRSIKRHNVETLPHVLALRIDENIIFANATQIEAKLIKRVQKRPGTEHLLIVCSSINLIDATGLHMLLRLNHHLAQANVTMSLSEVKGPLMTQLNAANFIEAVSGESYFTTDMAMRRLAEVNERGEQP